MEIIPTLGWFISSLAIVGSLTRSSVLIREVKMASLSRSCVIREYLVTWNFDLITYSLTNFIFSFMLLVCI